MGVGYESYTESGKLQFNSEMMTYALRSSGTAYVENRKVGNTSPTSLMLPAAYSGNLVAISGGGGYAVGYAGLYYTNGTSYRIYASNAPAGVAFDYFIFDRSNNIPPSNFGLEVRNEAGEITFSSNQRCMRVLNLSDGYDVSYGGKRLAVAQGQWSGHRISGQIDYYGGGGGGIGGPSVELPPDVDNPGHNYQYGWQNDGKIYGFRFEDGDQTMRNTHLSYDDVYIGPSPDNNQPPDYIVPPKFFVIDVTGFPVGGTFF